MLRPVPDAVTEGPSLTDAVAARPAEEPPMPWEVAVPEPLDAGPVVTAEVDAEASAAPADVDAWAASLPADAGQALPPWQDEVESVAELSAPHLEQATAGGDGAPAEDPAREFPLDAFIIPEDTKRIPAGVAASEELQRQLAEEVAARLVTLAAQLRERGLAALLEPSNDREPVDVILAAVLSGYLSRNAH